MVQLPMPARVGVPPAPLPLVDLLKLGGSLRKVQDFEEAENIIEWLSLRVHELTGIPYSEILAAILPLSRNEPLDGFGDRSAGAYFRPKLTHVLAALRELDKDGTTERIWRQLCHQWPLFMEGLQPIQQRLALHHPEATGPQNQGGLGNQQKDKSHPDGVEGGRWIWWKDKRYDVPEGTVYRMIEYMWDRDSASYDELFGSVFDEPVEPQTIRSTAHKVKATLLKIGIPWCLRTDATNRFITKKQNP
jgi:hypothetical protein